MPDICVDWFSGAGAQLELFSPERGAGADYRLKYIPPFRSTIRPPLEELRLGSGELVPVDQELENVIRSVQNAVTRSGPAPAAGPGQSEVLRQMKLVGVQLFQLLVPLYVEVDLRGGGLFLEVGTDEELVKYPLELMHDGDNFLCLKHYLGRFVNSTSRATPSSSRPALPGRTVTKLSILLISVPNPQTRPGGTPYEMLVGAEEETNAILNTFSGVDWVEVKLLKGKQATYSDVFQAFSVGGYHIIHYSGHAYFNDRTPHMSSLVLYDRDMSTGQIAKFIGRNPPVLCFMNACQTGLTPEWNNKYNIFGLAQAFLMTGAYLLGSRWNLSDQAAPAFANQFYTALLKGPATKPIGQAIMEARSACQAASQIDEFAWASYVFYGDPRVYFRKI